MSDQAKNISEKLSEILQTLTLKQVSEAKSPRALNDFGKQVLDQSGIRQIVEPKLEQITDTVNRITHKTHTRFKKCCYRHRARTQR